MDNILNMKTIIIAEAGVNHNGDLNLAKKLIDVAAKSGSDYVKFQTFAAKTLVTKDAKMANYQMTQVKDKVSQFDMIKDLELKFKDHLILKDYCKQKKIKFLSTPFDIASVKLLIDLGVEVIKIPSGEITNLPYLRYIGSLKKPVIISTGMSNMEEVKAAKMVLIDEGVREDQLIVLHCNTEYPTPMKDVNLRAMITMRDELKVGIGYSDHTVGFEASVAAVALGAKVIEKHFTLDRKLPGPDHSASLEPEELFEMVKSIRNIEKAMGSKIKRPSKSEKKNILVIRKSIVANNKIKKGEKFSENNLTTKRPGNGISPMLWDSVIGSTALKNYNEDDII
jgi:N,N'-diacetyllegionaminate synthase